MAALPSAELGLLRDARRAVLATIGPSGAPRLVPITFALDDLSGGRVLYSPLDEKPKSVSDPRELARVRDIVQRPRVSVLVDRWSEDWAELHWVRLDGSARVIEPDGEDGPEHTRAVALLRARYRQYESHALETRPMIRVAIESTARWKAGP